MESDFFNYSRTVAEGFLQTVVVVDDEANFNKPEEPARIRAPGRKSASNAAKEGLPSERRQVESGKEGDHFLDAGKTVESFAEKGIVCSVLKPSQHSRNSIKDTLLKLASGTDIFVIDWSMQNDSGDLAKTIITEIAQFHHESPGQLILLAVYTAQPDLHSIAEQLIVELKSLKPETADGGLTLKLKSARIIVLGKSGVVSPRNGRVVSFENIADRLIEEYTFMTKGLVSNAALGSLTLVRKNTHKILNKFTSELDPVFISHRAMLSQPDDAGSFLISLISRELRSVLEEGRAEDHAGMRAITFWLDDLPQKEFKIGNQTLSKEKATQLIREGIESEIISKSNPHKLFLSGMFCNPPRQDHALEEQFTVLTSLRSYYSSKKRKLTLGTILEKSDDRSFWICLQPLCDATNIKSEIRQFPFLPLQKPTEIRKNFDIVILKRPDEYSRFRVDLKTYNLRLFPFSASSEGIVLSSQGEDGHFYESAGKVFRWVGELRKEQALRLANVFAREVGRVGLDDFEWLRRWSH